MSKIKKIKGEITIPQNFEIEEDEDNITIILSPPFFELIEKGDEIHISFFYKY